MAAEPKSKPPQLIPHTFLHGHGEPSTFLLENKDRQGARGSLARVEGGLPEQRQSREGTWLPSHMPPVSMPLHPGLLQTQVYLSQRP